jgi:hypothetical protein
MSVEGSVRESRDMTKGVLSTSDNGHYVAHSLALRNAIRMWCCVEKGTVTKNKGFYYTSNG